MQAVFGLARETKNSLLIMDYENTAGREFHFHSQIEIVLLNNGTMESWVGNNKYSLKAGDILVSLSYEPHVNRGFKSSATFIFIPLYYAEDFIEATKNKKAINPVIKNEKAFGIISGACTELKNENLNPLEKKGYVEIILGTILRYISLDERECDTDPSLMSKILLYINTNYKNSITPESLASIFGYSKEYIASNFRESFKVGIKKYLNTIRLKNALVLIREQKMNFADCAFECGFTSLRTFYRVFETELKCTPKEYVASMKK